MSTRKRLRIFLSILAVVISGAFLVIKLAQGYRPDFSTKSLLPNGLLVATSNPNGAQLYIDGRLKSATNTTLNLSPGEYEVEIKKDGYIPWKKTLIIKKELVTKTDAYLFPTFPDFKPLTFTGVQSPILSPDGQKVVFTVSENSIERDGLWILDLDSRLGFLKEPRKIVVSVPRGRDFSQAELTWSPDSKQILASLATGKIQENFLLEINQLNPATRLVDVSNQIRIIQASWEEEKEFRFGTELEKLPEELLEILPGTTKNLQFSPDDTKVLYTATASAQIPEEIIPPLPAANPRPESRNTEAGKIYVYDLKEDKNFYLMDESESQRLAWFPTSKHIFLVQEEKVTILEYDNANWIDVYTGPFEDSFAYSFPDGNRILILTTLGKSTPPNLYAISLK